MLPSPVNITIMPSESSFKKQTELVREALKNFMTVRALKAPRIVKTAVFDLVNATIALNPFIPFFLSHDLFQELVPAIFAVLNDFMTNNSSFVMPKLMDKIAILNNRVCGSLTQNIKKGMNIHFFYSFLFCLCLFLSSVDVVPPPTPHADSKATKVKTGAVHPTFYFCFIAFTNPLMLEQASSCC